MLRFVRDVAIPNPCIGMNCGRVVHPELGPMLISQVHAVGLGGLPEERATCN